MEIEQLEELEQCKEWLVRFPLLTMKKLGIIPDSRDKAELAGSLLKFFRVASPKQWEYIYAGNSLAFKIDLCYTTQAEVISVGLRLGEIQAEKLQLSEFNKKKVKDNYAKFQGICYNHSDNWLEELQNLCTSCGIALVYTPKVEKAPIYGATGGIINNTIPLIQITNRRKDYNAFWFTFYHELAHILKHGKKDIFIEGIESIQPDQEIEKEADAFAARMILSEKERNELLNYDEYNKKVILEPSKKFKKHPGIIVAQLQRPYNHLYKNTRLNNLKTKVEFSEFTL